MPSLDKHAFELSLEKSSVDVSTLKKSSSIEMAAAETLLAMSSSAQSSSIKASSDQASHVGASSSKRSKTKAAKPGHQTGSQLHIRRHSDELESSQSSLGEIVQCTTGNMCSWHKLDFGFQNSPLDPQQDFVLFPRSQDVNMERKPSLRGNKQGESAYDGTYRGTILLDNCPAEEDDTCAYSDHTKYIPLFNSFMDMNETSRESEYSNTQDEQDARSTSGEVSN